MDKKALIDLLTYDAWAMNKILVASASHPNEFPTRFHEVMSHIFNAQSVWLSRMKGEEVQHEVWAEQDAQRWADIHQELTREVQRFLRELPDAALNESFQYINSKGVEFSNTYREIFTHLVLHGQYHRGQLVQLMKTVVETLPATDYVFYKR